MDGRTAPRTAAMDTIRSAEFRVGGRRYENRNTTTTFQVARTDGRRPVLGPWIRSVEVRGGGVVMRMGTQ